MTTNDVHPQPWLHHYPEGIDWSTPLTRRALNEYIDCLLYTSDAADE